MKIFSVIQELELVYYFSQAGKLQYGLTKKGALKFAFWNGYGMVSLCHRVGKLTNVPEICGQRTEEMARVLVFEET
jgi:hypothetical protein